MGRCGAIVVVYARDPPSTSNFDALLNFILCAIEHKSRSWSWVMGYGLRVMGYGLWVMVPILTKYKSRFWFWALCACTPASALFHLDQSARHGPLPKSYLAPSYNTIPPPPKACARSPAKHTFASAPASRSASTLSSSRPYMAPRIGGHAGITHRPCAPGRGNPPLPPLLAP